MRDEVMQATAAVRFHAGRDGGMTVVIITRTGYMALDQSILEHAARLAILARDA
jgi:hypothetical protein